MDENIQKITAPMYANGFVVGYVPAIHKKGSESIFQVSEYELELIAHHWAETIKDYQDEWDYFFQTGSTGIRLKPYAWYRLGKVQEILGADRLSQIIEQVDESRFVTRYYEDAETIAIGDQAAPEARRLYTTRSRCMVFHHSRVASRKVFADEEVVDGGWCWQTAPNFKCGLPIDNYGFASADAALESAQVWEDEFFQQIEADYEKALDSLNSQVPSPQQKQIVEDMQKMLERNPVQGSFREFPNNQDEHHNINTGNSFTLRRLEIQLHEENQFSGRILVNSITFYQPDYRSEIRIMATPLARKRHDAVVRSFITMEDTFNRANRDGQMHNNDTFKKILRASGFEDLTPRSETQPSLG